MNWIKITCLVNRFALILVMPTLVAMAYLTGVVNWDLYSVI